MGLLTDILTFPILGPIKSVFWVAEKINERVDQELYSEGNVRAKLLELELRYDLNEITEAEYLKAEEELLAWLKVIRQRRAAN